MNLKTLEIQFEQATMLEGADLERFLDGLRESERLQLSRLLGLKEEAASYFKQLDGFIGNPAEVEESFGDGKDIAHFKIEKLLGRGGCATVYVAADMRLNQQVALKVVRLSEVKNFRHFLREAQVIASVQHENICQILTSGFTDEKTGYIAMPLHSGRSLRAILEKGPLEPEQVKSIAVQTALGLQAAHNAGIVHRDIKPDNLFLTDTGTVKILDFGIARLESRESSTAEGMMKGTLPYMSPEHITDPPAGPAADYWALGVTIHELIAAEKPFYSISNRQCINAILNDPPARMDDIPAPLKMVVQKCLQKNPERRFKTASELIDMLNGAKN